MPTYAYACTACGHRFEVQQSFSDASLTECPECEGKLRKLFNTVGIVFKGSGFYRNDSRTPANASVERFVERVVERVVVGEHVEAGRDLVELVQLLRLVEAELAEAELLGLEAVGAVSARRLSGSPLVHSSFPIAPSSTAGPSCTPRRARCR